MTAGKVRCRTVTKDELFEAITVQRHRLVVTLEELSDDEWDAASLCAGWRVRDVVGHLVSILEVPLRSFLWGMVKARNFDRYADQMARQFGDRPPAELLAIYRAAADKRFAPPVVGPIAPLTDVLVHTRDIERPLGLPAALGADALRTALDYTCGGKARGFVPSARTAGLRFQATDLDWSIGSGELVRGPGDAILLAVTARRPALADLTGDGAATLAQRLA